MKRLLGSLLLVAVFATVLLGCNLAWSNHYYKNYELNVVMSARVGDPIIQYEVLRKNDVYGTPGDGFGQELIYGGVSKDVVKVMYRESGGPNANFARPAFSQDLQYDMAQSRIITYRSLKIEVLEYSNEIIRYKVLEGGSKLPVGVQWENTPVW